MTAQTMPSDTRRQMPQRPLATRYCCRCLADRPTKNGRYRGPLFTCAECEAKLQGGPKR